MLRNIKDLEGFAIRATDGVVGQVRDCYFDDEVWVVRYFIVESDPGPSHRRVLISPFSLGSPDWTGKVLPARLTLNQVENSPGVDTDKPVSRQHEMGYSAYYGYPSYWGGGGLWGAGFYPDILQAGLAPNLADRANAPAPRSNGRTPGVRRPTDTHLRSANNVMRYYVHAGDGDIGHVEGLLVEDKTWAVRYFLVNTSNWWLGHTVLISPEWIEDVFWAESKLVLSMSREAVKHAPAYHPNEFARGQEAALHAHYGHQGYWGIEAGPD
jgi:hypothetical protein